MTPVRERSSREEYLHWVHQFIAVARNKGYVDKANSIPSALRVCSCDGILKNKMLAQGFWHGSVTDVQGTLTPSHRQPGHQARTGSIPRYGCPPFIYYRGLICPISPSRPRSVYWLHAPRNPSSRGLVGMDVVAQGLGVAIDWR